MAVFLNREVPFPCYTASEFWNLTYSPGSPVAYVVGSWVLGSIGTVVIRGPRIHHPPQKGTQSVGNWVSRIRSFEHRCMPFTTLA